MRYRGRADDVITLTARRPHAVRAVTRFKMLLVMIRAVTPIDTTASS